jgi:hypothetical protein
MAAIQPQLGGAVTPIEALKYNGFDSMMEAIRWDRGIGRIV